MEILRQKLLHIICEENTNGQYYFDSCFCKIPFELASGSIRGLSPIIDLFQCNDAYSGIKVALALAYDFN